MKNLFLACALLLFSTAAHAQYAEVTGTPRAIVHDNVSGKDVTIGIWAYSNPLVGTSVMLLEKDPVQGWISDWGSNPPIPLPQTGSTAAQAQAYIVTLLPAINGAIANRFAIPTTAPPVATGNALIDLVNQTLYASFQFQAVPNGATTLALK